MTSRDQKWTRAIVRERAKEAMSIFRRLPDQASSPQPYRSTLASLLGESKGSKKQKYTMTPEAIRRTEEFVDVWSNYLTSRERDLVWWRGLGMQVKIIARNLGLQPKTITNYVANAHDKLAAALQGSGVPVEVAGAEFQADQVDAEWADDEGGG